MMASARRIDWKFGRQLLRTASSKPIRIRRWSFEAGRDLAAQLYRHALGGGPAPAAPDQFLRGSPRVQPMNVGREIYHMLARCSVQSNGMVELEACDAVSRGSDCRPFITR